jgi:integrase
MTRHARSIRATGQGINSKTSTVHGFRAVASTLLNEMGFRPDWIERQLAHDERNKVRAAYNHAQYLPERRRMMQQWADYLDDLAEGRPTGAAPIWQRSKMVS